MSHKTTIRLIASAALILVTASCVGTREGGPDFTPGRIARIDWDLNIVLFRAAADQKVKMGDWLEIHHKGEYIGLVRTTRFYHAKDLWVAEIFVRTYNRHFEVGDRLKIRDKTKAQLR